MKEVNLALERERLAEMIVALRSGRTVILMGGPEEGCAGIWEALIECAGKKGVMTYIWPTRLTEAEQGRVENGRIGAVLLGADAAAVASIAGGAEARRANGGAMLVMTEARSNIGKHRILQAAQKIPECAVLDLDSLFGQESFVTGYRGVKGSLNLALSDGWVDETGTLFCNEDGWAKTLRRAEELGATKMVEPKLWGFTI